jgi:hypothetical protein
MKTSKEIFEECTEECKKNCFNQLILKCSDPIVAKAAMLAKLEEME